MIEPRMNETVSRLVLLTPQITDAEAFRPALEAACAVGGVASVILRLGPADERTLINRVKALAPVAQAHDAALVVAFAGAHETGHDIATIAARGGADGVHIEDGAELRLLRERYRDGRIVGAGNIHTRHDAMDAGEAGADYVLFGEPQPDGSAPPLETAIEQAHWWAEIFETPCIAVAPSLDAVEEIAATRAEFVALGDAVWSHPAGPAAAVAAARAALAGMTQAGS
jgi:thiamine-phosphate pyrophosphorylase